MSAWDVIMTCGGELVLLGVLLGLSAFFSGSETALFSLSGADLEAFGSGKSRLRRRTAALINTPRRTLAAILLGNQFVNVAFFAVSAEMLLKLKRSGVGPTAMVIAAAMPLIVLVILGEICPKNIAIAIPRGFSMLSTWPLVVLVKILAPLNFLLVAIVEPVTRLLMPVGASTDTRIHGHELHRLMQLSQRRGLLAPDETRWIGEVLRLGHRNVGEIMVPRVDMISFDLARGRDALKALFAETSLGKVPVYRDDPDCIEGLIHARKLILQPEATLDSLTEEPVFIPEQASIEKLLVQLRIRQSHLAIVVDEYGGIAGLVTMEDAIEQIVGDLATEGESEVAPMREILQDEYLVDGSLSLNDWSAVFGNRFNIQGVTTIGGAVTAMLNRLPATGDCVENDEFVFTVEEMSGRRIKTLRIALVKGGGNE